MKGIENIKRAVGVRRVISGRSGQVLLCGVLLSGMTAFAQPIPGSYIAVFKDDGGNPNAAARELENQHGVNVNHVYKNSVHGFSFQGNDNAVQALARNPRIAYVEQDQEAQAWAVSIPTGVSRIGIDAAALSTIQSGPISSGGRVAANIAIIDTGIQRDHPNLNVDPNGIHFYTATVKGKTQTVSDTKFDDDNGHGTHVSGTVAANGVAGVNGATPIVGVAPGALVTGVKVLAANGSAPMSIVIAGVDWVAGQPGRFDVANMSLGGGFSQAMNDAVKNATAKGIVFAVAAGNGSSDVSQFSPASEPTAITVSALVDLDGLPGGLDTVDTYSSCKSSDTDTGSVHHDDEVPCWSNYGAGVDIRAPGALIYSTWPTSLLPAGYNRISGTSMATPHVAGAAALYIAKNRANRTQTYAWVQQVANALTSSGWRVGDYGYHDYYTRTPYTGTPKGDKDSIREPLLNVSALLDLTTRPNPDFAVQISQPLDNTGFPSGATVTFSGTAAIGAEDLSSDIVWISNIDGVLGQAASVAAALSDGTHIVTASTPDSVTTFGGADSIVVVVGAATPAPKQLFITLSFNKSGNPPVYYDGETMHSYFDVKDELGAPVEGATVSSVMNTPAGGTLTASGLTDATGRFDASMRMNGKRGGGYGEYPVSGSATKSGYLRSGTVSGKFVLSK